MCLTATSYKSYHLFFCAHFAARVPSNGIDRQNWRRRKRERSWRRDSELQIEWKSAESLILRLQFSPKDCYLTHSFGFLFSVFSPPPPPSFCFRSLARLAVFLPLHILDWQPQVGRF